MSDIERLLVMLFGEPINVRAALGGGIRYEYKNTRIYEEHVCRVYDDNLGIRPTYIRASADLYRFLIDKDLLKLREELCMI